MTVTPDQRPLLRGADMRVSHVRRPHVRFHPCYHFIEHHLTRQPAVHRLGGVESSVLEELVRRGSAAAPAEITAVAPARVDAAADFAADGAEKGSRRDVGEWVRGNM